MFRIDHSELSYPQTIFEWYKKQNDINFSPDYQRFSNIWKLPKKQLLIDTIINGYDIPKFYIHVVDRNNEIKDSNKRYAIIDGKQRLETIFSFMENEFELDEHFRYLKNDDIKLGGLKYNQISRQYPSIKSIFDNYILDIMLVFTDERERIEELFKRLNEGSPLNSAEKRNAILGEATTSIRKIANEHEFFSNKVKFSNYRYEYYDIITRLLLLEFEGKFVALTKPALDEFVENNRNSNKTFNDTKEATVVNLDYMSKMFLNKDFLLRTKAIIPIYYWFARHHKDLGSDPKELRGFIEKFDKLKNENRLVKDEDKSVLLVEFDQLNQQGSWKIDSLSRRYEILTKYYNEYIKCGNISLKTIFENEEKDKTLEEDYS